MIDKLSPHHLLTVIAKSRSNGKNRKTIVPWAIQLPDF